MFREIPNCLAIARPDNRSDRCNRRISAQSATVITLLIIEEWLTYQPQDVAQYSTADDTLGPGSLGSTGIPGRDPQAVLSAGTSV